MVKEVEQLMSDTSLNNLKALWEKLDSQKINDEKQQNNNQNSLIHNVSHCQQNSKLRNCWIPPNFAKLPIYNDDSKNSSKSFSMAYTDEETKNNNIPKVNKIITLGICAKNGINLQTNIN